MRTLSSTPHPTGRCVVGHHQQGSLPKLLPAVLVLVFGCGCGDTRVTPPSTAADLPTIELGADSANFTAIQYGAAPAPLRIPITNTGKGSLPITLDTAGIPNWLSVSLDAGVTPTILDIEPGLTGTVGLRQEVYPLSAGTYTAAVRVVSGVMGVTESAQTVAVTMTVVPLPPGAGETVRLSNVSFSARGGSAGNLVQNLTITNTGSNTVWSLSYDSVTYAPGQPRGWLVTETSFFPPNIEPGNAAVGSVIANGQSLPVGTYSASIWVSGANTRTSTAAPASFTVTP